jgi:hypothetical protein
MRFVVDPWDPSYGTSVDEPVDASEPVEVDVEVPAAQWAPIGGDGQGFGGTVVFVDGVRRIDARVWVSDDAAGVAEPGIAASWAAGAVVCNGAARVTAVEVRRGLFSACVTATDLPTAHGTYVMRAATSGAPEDLSLALQQAMTDSEIAVSQHVRDEGPGLLVLDGPLRGRNGLPDAIGMVKTHHRHYLPDALRPLLGQLDPGERTPVMRIGGRFLRLSWYVRLPGHSVGPMAGVVRCECSPHVPLADAVQMAGWSAAVLPRYASEAHKEARAPQNLYPIAGLERDLRHRLGDSRLLYRGLRLAAA